MSGTLYLRVLRIERVKVRCQRAGWGAVANAFSVVSWVGSSVTQGCSNPGLALANAFGVTASRRLDMVSRDVRSVTRNA